MYAAHVCPVCPEHLHYIGHHYEKDGIVTLSHSLLVRFISSFHSQVNILSIILQKPFLCEHHPHP